MFTLLEVDIVPKAIDIQVPRSAGVFQLIDCLLQSVDQVFISRLHEILWLCHEDLFRNGAI